MEVKAKTKHIRMSPRKIRLVVDVIRGLVISQALDQLKFLNKKAVRPVEKLIKSCLANAEHNYELDKNNLYIKEIRVDEGSTLHRWMPRAHGRATPIRKRTSHIILTLAEIKESGRTGAKKRKVEAAIKLDGKPKEAEEKGLKVKEKKETKQEKKDNIIEKGKEIVDPGFEGRGGQTKVEGSSYRGMAKRFFRRKSG